MVSNKFTYILSAIEIIGLILMIFINNNVIRISIFVFLMPVTLISGQIKKQLYSENKNSQNKNSENKDSDSNKK